MKTLKKELPFIIIALIPFAYLAFIYNDLPQTLPMHYDIHGNVDRFGNKSELILLTSILSGLGYFLFLIIPSIDPKMKIQEMESKYYSIRLVTSVFLTFLTLFILYSSNSTSMNPKVLFAILGMFFAFLGNYFKTIKPNYFIGIRTPWTLENETIWKKTHLIAGKIWFVGGILIACGYFLPNNLNQIVVFSLLGIIILFPIIYSYLEFKKSKSEHL